MPILPAKILEIVVTELRMSSNGGGFYDGDSDRFGIYMERNVETARYASQLTKPCLSPLLNSVQSHFALRSKSHQDISAKILCKGSLNSNSGAEERVQ